MFEIYINVTTISMVVMAVIAIPILLPLLFIQHYIYKKILDPKYFNAKHFSANELVVFTSGLIFYIPKTLVYVRAIALPKTMKVRFKNDVLTFKENPVIYLLACFTMLLITLGALGVMNAIIFSVLWSYYN